jgi:hypothetical protein
MTHSILDKQMHLQQLEDFLPVLREKLESGKSPSDILYEMHQALKSLREINDAEEFERSGFDPSQNDFAD